jgi:CRP/FNR family transcriptional regulator, cyclic AMP receptor protein
MLDHATLRGIPLFSRLSDIELGSLRERLKLREIRKNVIILKEGGLGRELLIILTGSVRVFRAGERGKEVTLAVLNGGDFFGEIALLTSSARTAHVIALEKTTLLELSKDDFITHLGKYSGLPLALAQSLADRLRLASGKLADMALLDVPHRLLTTLAKMSAVHPSGKGRIVLDRPTHQELADMVGSSREVISRCLKSLEQQGQLCVEGKNIVLFEGAE